MEDYIFYTERIEDFLNQDEKQTKNTYYFKEKKSKEDTVIKLGTIYITTDYKNNINLSKEIYVNSINGINKTYKIKISDDKLNEIDFNSSEMDKNIKIHFIKNFYSKNYSSIELIKK